MLIVRWKPPPHGHYKLNFDGSFSSPALVGGVICEEHGNWKMGFHQQHQGFNATQWKYWHCLEALS